MTIKNLSVADVKSLDDVAFVDVREIDEWTEGHIEGALHVPLSALMENPSMFKRPDAVHCVLYCKGGVRSMKAAEILTAYGEGELINMDGGYMSWSQAQES